MQNRRIDSPKPLRGQVLNTVQNQVAGKHGGWDARGPHFNRNIEKIQTYAWEITKSGQHYLTLSTGNARKNYMPSLVSSHKMIKVIKHASVMSPRSLSLLLLTLANLLIPISIFIFATGFFPYKPFIPGRATFQDPNNGGQLASAPFDKVIFMVVDALRRLPPILHQRQSITLILLVTSSTLPSRASNLLKRELSVWCI